MGLDIAVYTNAKLYEGDTEGDWDLVHVSNAGFPDRLGNMQEGYYEADEGKRFRAGSYSGYNAWRDWLCRSIYGISAEEFWESDKTDSSEPFAELINMSDCEGDIGTCVCEKLANDFDEHYEKLATLADEYELASLDNWREAFREAADNEGLVSFH